jgi:tetratricopeptide (TPR) repeat protein
LDRVLKAREVATTPKKDDWASALLGRGRALLRLRRIAEARKVFEEYLERYADGTVPSTDSIEAAWLLVGVAIEERQWAAALARLKELDSIVSRIAEPDRAPHARLLRDARSMRGEIHLSLGDFESALRAFADADDPLLGLIGRARALARLGRKEEARKEYAGARKLFDEKNPPAGPGREYWEIALDALEREVR